MKERDRQTDRQRQIERKAGPDRGEEEVTDTQSTGESEKHAEIFPRRKRGLSPRGAGM